MRGTPILHSRKIERPSIFEFTANSFFARFLKKIEPKEPKTEAATKIRTAKA